MIHTTALTSNTPPQTPATIPTHPGGINDELSLFVGVSPVSRFEFGVGIGVGDGVGDGVGVERCTSGGVAVVIGELIAGVLVVFVGVVVGIGDGACDGVLELAGVEICLDVELVEDFFVVLDVVVVIRVIAFVIAVAEFVLDVVFGVDIVVNVVVQLFTHSLAGKIVVPLMKALP